MEASTLKNAVVVMFNKHESIELSSRLPQQQVNTSNYNKNLTKGNIYQKLSKLMKIDIRKATMKE